jgi:hypothetical protein
MVFFLLFFSAKMRKKDINQPTSHFSFPNLEHLALALMEDKIT